ncbi:Zn(II)2Cys6 transcription factor domain-containing protein [Aspergillus luchuensis]|uniref:Uncharacterized protein n=1 Tax=Aspergillus kawachii TaxID=1069201 RepID=A0A7R7WJE0_ASPKA|nr:uncharacterized protein AKAW2_70917A [Aspergillus luchuensis]BCS04039.1 hypothetical protein AKAW2_70917A [Aspergillus luchuensis]BCS15643.1 hypothetical protein ALUC_70876A [Aspergillus luchuensis]GAA89785.1 hypothetical protein AKAW_07899 [Aspergillus luchuensis IFO 4308]
MDQPPTQYDLAPAPYGRACMNCSQSKCKCILPKGGGRCQRCQRLNKECRPSAFHRRQNARKSSLPKTGRLEKKLDELVTLLRAQSSNNAGDYAELIEELRREPDEDHHHPPPPRSQIKVTRTVSTAEKSIDCGFLNHFAQVGATLSRDESNSGGHLPNASTAEPTRSQAEEYLSIFVTQKLPYLPFVYFPPGTTAQHLRSDRPFLWLCIMAVTSKSPSQRRTLCDRIRETVAQRMVHDCYGRDLDFLLGLLVYIAWSNQQVFKKLNMTIYSQFATAIVYDLMLNQAPGGDKPSLLTILQTHPDEDPSPPPTRTMDERRAVLGCFLLTSSISLFLEKSDPLRWTPHMDECLHHLLEHPECLNDEILAQQARFQLINERINTTTTTTDPYHTNLPSIISPLSTIYTHTLTTHLHQTQSKLTPNSQGHRILHLHHSNTHLTIHQSALLKQPPTSPTTTTSSSPSTTSTTNQLHHLESLHACLSATSTWLTTFLAIPPAEYAGFPFPIFAQLVRHLAALYRLSTLDDDDGDHNPAWDRGHVQQTIDLMEVMDRLIGNLGQAAALARLEAQGEDEDEDVFFYSIGKYESVRLKWGGVFGGRDGNGNGGEVEGQGQGVQDGSSANGLGQGHGHGQVQDMGGLGVGYDDWLGEFLNSMVH